jgi:vacuolar iron transporter family protein
MSNDNFSHFKGKDALKHIVEVQANGVLASSEIHGAETPGSVTACFDASKEAAVVLFATSLLLYTCGLPKEQIIHLFIGFSLSLLFWKFGRAAFLAWSRLERLHRVAAEEQGEIQDNREQERQELKALYQAKGFHGKLLDDVVDVLMADSDRLLRVMLEEELGFRLEENEHPLIQGLGASLGVLFASIFTIGGFYVADCIGLLLGALLAFIVSAAYSAYRERNRIVPAIVWNIGIAILAIAATYYFLQ